LADRQSLAGFIFFCCLPCLFASTQTLPECLVYRLTCMHESDSTLINTRRFEAFMAEQHPCVGALSALHRSRIRYAAFAGLGESLGQDIRRLCDALEDFSREFPEPGDDPVSFVAMFEDSTTQSVAGLASLASLPSHEHEFETRMWRHLQDLCDLDREHHRWDSTVSADPASPQFSLSVAGRAFYVIGLHPAASRIARRAPMPCLVFNFHDQFESLRQSGKYDGYQRATRARDTALQGSINPSLAPFGAASEARQYSGRAVGPNWQCPLRTGVGNAR
jgi:FPC/CPF motif-containing protein YcgG